MSMLHKLDMQSIFLNSWFAINLSGYGGQCQPPTPAGSDNGINNIFLYVVPNMAAMTSNANHQYDCNYYTIIDTTLLHDGYTGHKYFVVNHQYDCNYYTIIDATLLHDGYTGHEYFVVNYQS